VTDTVNKAIQCSTTTVHCLFLY